MRAARSLALIAVVCGAGCYRYVPASTTDLTPPGDVRLRVNEAEATRLAGVIPPGTRVIEGRLVEDRPDSVMLLVSIFSELQGNRVVNLNQRMNVARGSIVDVERRTLDQTRTILVAAGGGVVVGSVVGLILSGGFDSKRGPDVIPPVDIVIPLFRWRW